MVYNRTRSPETPEDVAEDGGSFLEEPQEEAELLRTEVHDGLSVRVHHLVGDEELFHLRFAGLDVGYSLFVLEHLSDG